METKQYTTLLKWMLIILNIFLHETQCSSENSSAIWKEITKFMSGSSYNRYLRPEADTGNITVVFLNVFVEAVGEMNANKELPLFIMVTESWTDKRLDLKKLPQSKSLYLSGLTGLLWRPNLIFGNVGIKQDVKIYSRKLVLKPNSELTLTYQVTFPVSCQKHLKIFPLDGQMCTIKIKSFYYPAEEVQLKWESNTDWQKSMDKLEIPHYDLKNIILLEKNISQLGQNWSQVEANLHLKRKFSLQIMVVFFTSTILVIIGGLSFWIDAESTAARMSLGLITLLTLITHNSSLHPSKDYFATGMLGIDIWLIICLSFVFAALIEFILLNHSITYHRKFKMTNNQPSHVSFPSREQVNILDKKENHANRMVIERDVDKYKITADNNENEGKRTNKADRYCRVIFPCAFIVTNIIYWVWHFC